MIDVAGIRTTKPAFAKRYDGKLLREDYIQPVHGLEDPEELENERTRRADARQGDTTVEPGPLRHSGNIPVYKPGYEKQIGMSLYEKNLKSQEDADARARGLDPEQAAPPSRSLPRIVPWYGWPGSPYDTRMWQIPRATRRNTNPF